MIFSTKLTASAVAATALLASVGNAAPATPMSKFNKRDLRFNFGQDKVRGVNLGGWLVLEPFISPAMFEIYGTGPEQTKDEYHLSLAMKADTTGKGFDHLREHYKTFIVRLLSAARYYAS